MHQFTGTSGRKGSTQYTLNVANMTQTSDNKAGTVRRLVRAVVAPPPTTDHLLPGVRAPQDKGKGWCKDLGKGGGGEE